MSTSQRRPRAPTKKLLDDVRTAIVNPKNADRPPLTFFHDLAIRHGPKLAAALTWLGAREAESVHHRVMSLLLVAARDPRIAPAVKRRFFGTAAKHALAAIRDPKVSDDRKLTLTSILQIAGSPIPPGEVRSCFHDYDAAVAKLKRERLSEFPDTLGAVEGILEAAGLVDHDQPSHVVTANQVEEAVVFGAETIQSNAPIGVSLLCCAAAVANQHGVATEASIKALEVAAATRHPRAAYLLGELGRWPRSTITERARQLADELRVLGVNGTGARVGEFSHGIALGVDGAGSRSVAVFFKTGDGALHALSLLLNDEVGIKDAWPTWNDGAELEAKLRETSFTVAPCDLGFARRLVADALYRHEKIGRPVPGRFLLYRAFLGGEVITPAEHRPDLGVYLLETVVRGPTIADGSDSLLEHPLYRQLWFASEAAYDFVRRLRRRRFKGGVPLEQIVDEFLAAVASEKNVLARRLAANLEIEARAGRAKHALNRMAARVLVALNEGVVPFEKIPYVVALGSYAVESISAALRDGYKSQAEVNAEGLEHDAVLAQLMDALGLAE